MDVSVVMHTPDKIQISTSAKLQYFQKADTSGCVDKSSNGFW